MISKLVFLALAVAVASRPQDQHQHPPVAGGTGSGILNGAADRLIGTIDQLASHNGHIDGAVSGLRNEDGLPGDFEGFGESEHQFDGLESGLFERQFETGMEEGHSNTPNSGLRDTATGLLIRDFGPIQGSEFDHRAHNGREDESFGGTVDGYSREYDTGRVSQRGPLGTVGIEDTGTSDTSFRGSGESLDEDVTGSFTGFEKTSNPVVPILLDEREGPDAEGNYNFRFETGDGIYREEQGTPQGETGAVAQQGSWSFTLPDGTPAEFRFIADENGFRVESDLLPTPPPLPPHAIAQIERARQMADKQSESVNVANNDRPRPGPQQTPFTKQATSIQIPSSDFGGDRDSSSVNHRVAMAGQQALISGQIIADYEQRELDYQQQSGSGIFDYDNFSFDYDQGYDEIMPSNEHVSSHEQQLIERVASHGHGSGKIHSDYEDNQRSPTLSPDDQQLFGENEETVNHLATVARQESSQFGQRSSGLSKEPTDGSQEHGDAEGSQSGILDDHTNYEYHSSLNGAEKPMNEHHSDEGQQLLNDHQQAAGISQHLSGVDHQPSRFSHQFSQHQIETRQQPAEGDRQVDVTEQKRVHPYPASSQQPSVEERRPNTNEHQSPERNTQFTGLGHQSSAFEQRPSDEGQHTLNEEHSSGVSDQEANGYDYRTPENGLQLSVIG